MTPSLPSLGFTSSPPTLQQVIQVSACFHHIIYHAVAFLHVMSIAYQARQVSQCWCRASEWWLQSRSLSTMLIYGCAHAFDRHLHAYPQCARHSSQPSHVAAVLSDAVALLNWVCYRCKLQHRTQSLQAGAACTRLPDLQKPSEPDRYRAAAAACFREACQVSGHLAVSQSRHD